VVWYKDGKNMEGMHTVGDIITNVSVNCVINYMLRNYLHVYFYGFIFMGLSFLWFINVFLFMGISCICCMCMFMFISV